MEERLIRYDRDGSVSLIQDDRRMEIDPGWTDALLDRVAADFFEDADAA